MHRPITYGSLLLCVAATLVVATSQLAAQDLPEHVVRSNELFQQGKSAMEQGDVSTACELFEESNRLAPRGGTVLNLALCHERAGRLLIAYQEFIAARERARLDGRSDREEFATQHLATIEAKLGWLDLDWPESFRTAAARLRIDDEPVDIETTRPVLPGEHRLLVEADGFDPQQLSVVAQPGVHVNVVFQPLSLTPKPESPPAVLPREPLVAVLEPRASPAPPPENSLGALRTVALVAGIIGLTAGLATGAWAIERKSVVNRHCDSEAMICDATGLDANTTGAAVALASTVAFSTGIVGIGAWVLLPGGVFNPESHASTPRAGFVVRGSF